MVAEAYEQLAGEAAAVSLTYEPAWRRTGWRRRSRRRATTTCAAACRPSVRIATSSRSSLGGLPARTHASQGEQRTLALALRLAAHRLVAERTGSTPVLVLDDVLSELDPERATALLANLPPGQVVITSASPLPAGGQS